MKKICAIILLSLFYFAESSLGTVIFDENFASPSLDGWSITYGNTDADNCTYEVDESGVSLAGIAPTGDNLWTSFGLHRFVSNVGDFNFKTRTFWHQQDIESAPFIKILLYSQGHLVLSLSYEDRSKAGFGVNRSYGTNDGFNLIDSPPSAEGFADWEIDRIDGNGVVRLNDEVFFTFTDSNPITLIRVYFQGYAMVNSSMPWQWQQPLRIGLEHIKLTNEPQNPLPSPPTLRLPSIFSDNMVLQQDKEIKIWGKGTTGEQVSVSFAGQSSQAIVDEDGKWAVALPPQEGGFEPYTMTVSSGEETVCFSNVLIGEVWLCSGQSNMEWWLGYTKDAPDELAASEDTDFRFFTVYQEVSDTPIEEPRARWLTARRDTVGDFSATAYHFGKYLKEHLDVPVGMVVAALGGTRAECWMSRVLLEEEFPSLIARWQQQLADYDPDTMHWQLNPMLAYYRPGGLYNGMIEPVKQYSIRGFTWYQGESNVERAEEYRTLFPALINNWRADWQDELPFIFVQLPNYGTRSAEPTQSQWAELRDAQNQALLLPNTAMAVTIDIGEPDNIHPDNKKELGRRLGLEARRIAYDELQLPRSPRFLAQTAKSYNGKVRLTFNYTSSLGLASHSGTKQVGGFTIKDDSGFFHNASAEIVGKDAVLVWADGVDNPVMVRYAWDNDPVAQLYDGGSELPVGTFQVPVVAGEHELASDFNYDGCVGLEDFAIFSSYWLLCNDPTNPVCM